MSDLPFDNIFYKRVVNKNFHLVIFKRIYNSLTAKLDFVHFKRDSKI